MKIVENINKERLSNVWRLMIGRCSGKWTNHFTKTVYLDKGITVCDEWKNSFDSFYSWAIAAGYSPGLELDRIDTYGNYEPSNCRFITHKENTRNRTNTRYITYKNETKPMAAWADQYQLSSSVLSGRLKNGWTLDEALNTPVLKKGERRRAIIMNKYENMSINERIRILRKNFLKISQEEFASKLKISRGNLSNIEIDRVNPTDRIISDICREFSINEKWLRDGIGDDENIFIKNTLFQGAYNQFGYIMENSSASKKAALTTLLELIYTLPDDQWNLIINKYEAAKEEAKREA